MNKKTKAKLPFIIGTTAMVANLGFSSLLIANAQWDGIIETDCPSFGVALTADDPELNFYTTPSFAVGETVVNNINPEFSSSATNVVYAEQDVTAAICPSFGSVSLQIQASDFIRTDDLYSLPIANKLLIYAPTPLTCETPWNCGTDQISPSLTTNSYWTSNNQVKTLYSWFYSGGINQPSGHYRTTLRFRLTIDPNKPPGTYTSSFVLTALR
ncbi:hypothetical protein GF376_03185 [Candidatus Peregrinibacteria bacterium]|nr:hypothetical protein [Candidatus Peregrinibacteria bacterium]